MFYRLFESGGLAVAGMENEENRIQANEPDC